MALVLFLTIKKLASGEVAAVVRQSLVVDVDAGIETPLEEGIKAHIRLENTDATSIQLIDSLLRGRLPVVVRWLPPSIKDRLNPREVVLPFDPCDGCDEGNGVGFVVHEPVSRLKGEGDPDHTIVEPSASPEMPGGARATHPSGEGG